MRLGTELEEIYPSHVLCTWIGNSRQVAERHYLQTTEEHYQKAAAATEGSSALQKALQQVHAIPRTDSLTTGSTHEKSPEKRGFANPCDSVQVYIMGDKGLEPLTPCL